MSAYAFHPDAFADLDEIWEYIAEDNVDAADRVLADIHSTLTTLAGSPEIGHRRPDLTNDAAASIPCRARRVPHRLRTCREAALDPGGVSRPPKSATYGGRSSRPRVIVIMRC